MFVIGITGGIGSGKSAAAAFLARCGLPVLDADQLAHEVTAQGGGAVPELVTLFGPDLLDEKGRLRRDWLADRIFQDRQALDRVNEIVHGQVLEEMGRRLQKLTKKRGQAVVLDVPLPVEKGFLDRCHFVIAVAADDELRVDRLVRRGLSEADARRRMAVQLSRQEYAARADVEIDNSGSLEAFQEAVFAIVEKELKSRGLARHFCRPETASEAAEAADGR